MVNVRKNEEVREDALVEVEVRKSKDLLIRSGTMNASKRSPERNRELHA